MFAKVHNNSQCVYSLNYQISQLLYFCNYSHATMNKSVADVVASHILDKTNKTALQEQVINQAKLGDLKRQHMRESRNVMDELQTRIQDQEDDYSGLYKKQLKKQEGERHVDVLYRIYEQMEQLKLILTEQFLKNYTLLYPNKYEANCLVIKNAYSQLGVQNKKIIEQGITIQEIQRDLLNYSSGMQKRLTNMKKDCNQQIQKLKQFNDIEDCLSYIDPNNYILSDMYTKVQHNITELTEIQKLKMRINIAFEHSISLNNKLLKLQQIAAFLTKKHKKNLQQAATQFNIEPEQPNKKEIMQQSKMTINSFMDKYIKTDEKQASQ